MNEELFRKSSVEYMNSQDKLDTYIKVTNPGAWVTVTGIFVLMFCAVVWSQASSLKTTVPVAGMVEEKEIHVFVSPEEAEEFERGMAVEQARQKIGEIRRIAKEPVRREMAGIGYLSEYFRDTRLGKWNVEIVVSNDRRLPEGEEIHGAVVTEESGILDLIMGTVQE